VPKNIQLSSVVLGFALSGLVLICGSPAAADDETDTIYKSRCLNCHAANGDGNGHARMRVKPLDLRSDAVQKKSDEDLYSAIAFGTGHIQYPHAFSKRGLTTEQITKLVTYIRAFASKKNK